MLEESFSPYVPRVPWWVYISGYTAPYTTLGTPSCHTRYRTARHGGAAGARLPR